MYTITENVPNDIPPWALKAIADGRLLETLFARLQDMKNNRDIWRKAHIEYCKKVKIWRASHTITIAEMFCLSLDTTDNLSVDNLLLDNLLSKLYKEYQELEKLKISMPDNTLSPKKMKEADKTNSTIKEIYLPEKLPEDLIMKIGKYLVSDESDIHSAHLFCRITDKSDGYYTVCCLLKKEYDKYPQYYDGMNDISFKTLCDCNSNAGWAIIPTSKYPKHDSRFFVNGRQLNFLQSYTVIQMLKDYIIEKQ